jgi:hypothetical protein
MVAFAPTQVNVIRCFASNDKPGRSGALRLAGVRENGTWIASIVQVNRTPGFSRLGL